MTTSPKSHLSGKPAQLEPVLNAMVEALVVSDRAGTIEQINEATINMFGYTRDELVGENISMLMGGADRRRHDTYLDHYHRTGKKRIIGTGREIQARKKDGSEFPAHIAVGEVSQGADVMFVGLIRDLTAQRRIEEQALRQREEMVNVSRLSTMGEMAAAMAHELNQPLTAIANYSSACTRLLDNDSPAAMADVKNALLEINAQAHRAGEVISRTRGFTRSSDISRHITSLSKLANQIRTLAELDTKANNIALAWQIPTDLPKVDVDTVQIQQVILNLIRNAVDALHDCEPERRKITLQAKLTAPHEIRLEVIDHGPGVSESVAKEIFNAFFTTKQTGMGMGLAICRTIIRSHGGELGFRNNDGVRNRGATFFFTLPTQVED